MYQESLTFTQAINSEIAARSAASIAEEIEWVHSPDSDLSETERATLIEELTAEFDQYTLAESITALYETGDTNSDDMTALLTSWNTTTHVEAVSADEETSASTARKLPGTRSRTVCRVLGKFGITQIRQTGSHRILQGENTGIVIVPMHKGRDLPEGTFRSILRQANITPSDFMELA